jgi:hypothetical protein
MTLRGSALELFVRVESKTAQDLLQSRSADLQQALSDEGIEVDRFHVRLFERDGGASAGNGFSQDEGNERDGASQHPPHFKESESDLELESEETQGYGGGTARGFRLVDTRV